MDTNTIERRGVSVCACVCLHVYLWPLLECNTGRALTKGFQIWLGCLSQWMNYRKIYYVKSVSFRVVVSNGKRKKLP